MSRWSLGVIIQSTFFHSLKPGGGGVAVVRQCGWVRPPRPRDEPEWTEKRPLGAKTPLICSAR